MKALRSALGIEARAALVVTAIFSTPVTAAEFSPNSAEWPSGDGWIIQLNPPRATRATHDWEVPASPLLPDSVLPKATGIAATELEVEMTHTLRRDDRSRGKRRAWSAFHGECTRHKSRPAHCQGWMGHAGGRR
jgi:hypothetical protein